MFFLLFKKKFFCRKTFVLNGSITLEGAIIFPLTIVISMSVIFYSFLLHDKITIKTDFYRTLMNAYMTSSDHINIDDSYERLNSLCLLKHTYNIEYHRLSNSLIVDFPIHLMTNISFSGYNHCDYIRKYYFLIHLLE